MLKTAQFLESVGAQVTWLGVDAGGRVSVEALRNALETPADLVSIQWVNSETGVIQPIEEIASLCHEKGALFHTDAAQAVGKIPISVSRFPIDFLSLTGHKFHAPQGVGALYVRNPKILQPLLEGGDQESGLRPGTENLPGILGMARALELRFHRILAKPRQGNVILSDRDVLG